MKDTVIDIIGMRLVIDQKDNEFFLFLHSNESSDVLRGSLGGGSYLFNTPRGSGIDGYFTGDLKVKGLPFEYLKYSDVKIMHLLDTKSNDDLKSQTKKEENIVEHNYEFFDPIKFTDGSETNPPKTLSRKNRKKWYSEMKDWKEANAKKPTEATAIGTGNGGDSSVANNNNSPANDSSSERVVVVSNPKNKEKEDPYFGVDNTECTLADCPEGYILAHSNQKAEQNLVLGTPAINGTNKKLFFVCKKESTAQQLLDKLSDHPFYSKFVKDGATECKVYPVTLIPVSQWKEDALLVVNVYTLLNSELMLEVE